MSDKPRRRASDRYEGRIAADLPRLPLRLNATGLVIVAGAISKLAGSIRAIANGYEQADPAQQAYAQEKITRGVEQIAELWENLKRNG